MKHLLFCSVLSALCAVSASGATVTVPSTYDEASGQWIGDVVALTNALATTAKNSTIFLEKGVYDLTPLKDSPMYVDTSDYGNAILKAKNAGIKIKGQTGNPADVILTVSGTTIRVLVLKGSTGCGVYDLTITGGNATSGGSNYKTGGAVGLDSSTVVSNCVFYGNKASTAGGAVSGLSTSGKKGTVYDCVFYGNNSTQKGAAAAHSTFRNCVFSNNQVAAGSSYSGSIVWTAALYDCTLTNNCANGCGGARDCTVYNSKFFDNHDRSSNEANPGGGGARLSVCSNCVFYGNSAPRYGGAVRDGSLIDCVVISNRTRLTNALPGGGGVYEATSVINCLVVSNYTAGAGGGLWKCPYVCNVTSSYNRAEGNGGGLYSCATVDCCVVGYNYAAGNGGGLCSCATVDCCVVEYNYAAGNGGGLYGCATVDCSVVDYNYAADNGGGACYGTLTNCVLRGNVAGAGGGMYGGTAVGCVFADNANSSAEATTLIGCDVDTSYVASVPLADRCVFHEMSNDPELKRAIGNVAYPDGKTISTKYLFSASLVRNCLVTNCAASKTTSSGGNDNYLINGRLEARYENCTFYQNAYTYLTRYTVNGTDINPLSFVNCALGKVNAINGGYVSLSNCVYTSITKPTGGDWAEGYGAVNSKKVTDMKFLGTGEHPYTPKRKSPLIGYGQVLDWMREEGAVDLAGNPMLKSPDATTVDVGAYQCWLPVPGAVLLLK